ncbi:hypothetical protein LRS73_04355 [Methylobacterium currus]|uniref:hypothetical protein n=1 Tax=Methylobacterium currus TaxID=2051553 RepID=UPI001E37969D|nr:hypothetical protein [Methylobacterium currus]UHC17153.1 hypothetical protein LRS73_04355 [Methylobacterium currus]
MTDAKISAAAIRYGFDPYMSATASKPSSNSKTPDACLGGAAAIARGAGSLAGPMLSFSHHPI